MDPTEALSLPGVKSYISADDVPGENATELRHGVDNVQIYGTDKVRRHCEIDNYLIMEAFALICPLSPAFINYKSFQFKETFAKSIN